MRLRVTGRSMTPCLADDDLVTLQPVDPAKIRLGDLVYAKAPGQPARLHRVVRRARGTDGAPLFHTKGDALLGPDPPVRAAHVLGRVSRILRGDNRGERRQAPVEIHRRRFVRLSLALASRHAPRVFAALGRRLTSRLRQAGRR